MTVTVSALLQTDNANNILLYVKYAHYFDLLVVGGVYQWGTML